MAELPSGIVTFVFSDIEGSTRLLRRLGDEYSKVLDRHDQLLRQAWVEHAGVEVRNEGDGFFVAFALAADAVCACVEAQGLLRAETWPDDGVVRVRMGVHAGLAAPRGADYISYAIHQAARVVGAAHGGQVVVSADAVAEIAGSVPFEIQLLGRYRLRDFDEPVELFQAADDPQEDFGALRAIPAEGHNLIRPLTSYLGREADHAGVRSLLGPGRLVSVVGPGGVGKTRLAVETGLELASQWRDGVWLIELAPVVSGEFVASVVAAALGLATTDQAPLAVLVSQLRSSHTLIILDNCEHVRDAVSALVDLVLRECPEVAMLATSREPLGLGREVVWRLDPLGAEGVALFVERARTANANFAPNAESLAIVERICRRLDGLPLAIELAAAHVGHRNPAEILSGLDKRIGLLRSRRTDLDDRHCSLNALLDWSHELLNEQEGTVFRRLAVFAAGFSIEGAEAAAGWGILDADYVVEAMWALVDKSLLLADVAENQTRYRMLSTVQAYARTQLEQSSELATTALSIGVWLLDVVGPGNARDPRWVRDMRVEIDNVRAVIPILAQPAPELAQQLAYSIAELHDVDMSYTQGVLELDHNLDVLTSATSERLALLAHLGFMYVQQFQPIPERVIAEITSLADLGITEPNWCGGRLRTMMAVDRLHAGDPDAAQRIATKALDDSPTPLERARWLNLLGIVFTHQGALDTAAGYFEQAVAISRQLDDPRLNETSMSNLAEAYLELDNRRLAASSQLGALDVGVQFGLPTPIAFALIVAARLSGADGSWSDAVLLHTIADDIIKRNGIVLFDEDRQLSNDLLARAESALGTAAYAERRNQGRDRSIAEACVLAREHLVRFSSDSTDPTRTMSESHRPDALTTRPEDPTTETIDEAPTNLAP